MPWQLRRAGSGAQPARRSTTPQTNALEPTTPSPVIRQGPLSRFGDTAANTAVLTVLEDVDMPVAAKTVAASLAAGLFRIFLMPVDALKTIMQVEGASGLSSLGSKVKAGGPTVLYHGALAASAATFVGHYPWFATVSRG